MPYKSGRYCYSEPVWWGFDRAQKVEIGAIDWSTKCNKSYESFFAHFSHRICIALNPDVYGETVNQSQFADIPSALVQIKTPTMQSSHAPRYGAQYWWS